jgi:hypothetical protein
MAAHCFFASEAAVMDGTLLTEAVRQPPFDQARVGQVDESTAQFDSGPCVRVDFRAPPSDRPEMLGIGLARQAHRKPVTWLTVVETTPRPEDVSAGYAVGGTGSFRSPDTGATPDSAACMDTDRM